MGDRKNLDGNLVALEKHLAKHEPEECPWCDDDPCECDPEYEQSKDDALAEDKWDARSEE